ncbi:WD40 repeat-like protein [Tothia fuscella]|uniref:Target of rapamycin complex subunit LST8 n=1 Tax=Tothia fuscella TaxID=1048955 RepID=A0A9P4TTB5_9PEZI|nr:WD40 repeat-like protein [Tothia fuscella]
MAPMPPIQRDFIDLTGDDDEIPPVANTKSSAPQYEVPTTLKTKTPHPPSKQVNLPYQTPYLQVPNIMSKISVTMPHVTQRSGPAFGTFSVPSQTQGQKRKRKAQDAFQSKHVKSRTSLSTLTPTNGSTKGSSITTSSVPRPGVFTTTSTLPATTTPLLATTKGLAAQVRDTKPAEITALGIRDGKRSNIAPLGLELSGSLRNDSLARVQKPRESHGRTGFQELMAAAGPLDPPSLADDMPTTTDAATINKDLEYIPTQHLQDIARPSASAATTASTLLHTSLSHSSTAHTIPSRALISGRTPFDTKPSQNAPNPNTTTTVRRFADSRMPSRSGLPFTNAEQIMVGYLKEYEGLTWEQIDPKMGRTKNTCATKHYRKPNGLANYGVKLRWDYYTKIAALKAILAVFNPTIEAAFDYLTLHLDTNKLPPECVTLFEQFKAQTADLGPPAIQNRPVIPSLALLHTDAPTSQQNYQMDGRLRISARTTEGAFSLERPFQRDFDEAVKSPSPLLSPSSISTPDFESQFKEDLDSPNIYVEGAYVKRLRPYLKHSERMALNLEHMHDMTAFVWEHASIHIGFDNNEMEELLSCICTRLRKSRYVSKHTNSKHTNNTTLDRMTETMSGISQTQLRDIAAYAKKSRSLHRSRISIESFLADAVTGCCMAPTALRLHTRPGEGVGEGRGIRGLLLQRELGQRIPAIRNAVYDSMNPTLKFTGASGDVGTVAWSSDGNTFAAGAACLVDPSSMQYNRPNNLLFGNVSQKSLQELPEHSRPRQRAENGVNSTHSMHISQDSRLYETVTMVDFAPDGSFMYSAGYDNHLRAYRLDNTSETAFNEDVLSQSSSSETGRSKLRPPKPCRLRWEADHGAKLDVLTVSRLTGLIAIGCQADEDNIRVYRNDAGRFQSLAVFNPTRLGANQERKAYPSCLRWGSPAVQNYLLAGFSGPGEDSIYGETSVWDVERQKAVAVSPSTGNVFDANWSNSRLFISACAAYGLNVNKGAHSFIRIYDTVDLSRWSRSLEMDCPARDINDVLFSPYDQNYIAAGATDGTVYIWDIRRADTVLQQLDHGRPLMELDATLPREITDTGVRFCSWGQNRTQLHSGSSDGVIKIWDIYRSPEDVHTRDLITLNSGVYSGAFNHDFTSLLLGEVNGSINVLEVGAEELSFKDVPSFNLESATARTFKNPSGSTNDSESGLTIAKALQQSGQIKFAPMGGFPVRQAVQGSKYTGPYDQADDASNLRAQSTDFQARLGAQSQQERCQILLCRAAAVISTAEEEGDSGRSIDRIPQALRCSLQQDGSKVVVGMLRCSHCSLPARPRIGDPKQESFTLCERCGFSCFRCGDRIKVPPLMTKLACRSCGLEWDIGALGYDLLPLRSGIGKDRVALGTEKDTEMDVDVLIDVDAGSDLKDGGLDDMGDLLHLVEEYQHSFWQDRLSPPI